MAKPKQQGNVANRPLYSRISYLYQAAAYLSTTATNESSETSDLTPHVDVLPQAELAAASEKRPLEQQVKQSVARHLLTDMRSTSLKTQIRLSPAIKRTICKYCDTLLIDGQTCTSVIENTSKGSKKPWADVLVITCNICGGLKRFPVNAARQKRRPVRQEVAPGSSSLPQRSV
ncbi:hypothetical protein PFICI_10555 [Pestalotiopsis fici W106-1]|uniref:Uncharacterized protein n=1 Tax=Pestalotiopsis fici (strain W106-1 / CGMCC3.15140) TaxID=1229662 RepID=W3WX88_PESFW|nr:uncharacterized protein PFICI_10555 [Pestalotiopsis fici W106-1]ETS78493.1 hypothetical protein PFICI_10555 [Pestalotiopsis fici W106-1]